MSITFWHIVHVASALLLAGFTFHIAARPEPETKRRWLVTTGILSLLVLVGGMGLWGKKYGMSAQWWIFVKIGLWLGLSAFGGIIYRRPEKRSLFVALTALFAVLAVILVYTGQPS